MKDDRLKQSRAQLRSAISKLKKSGLYTPTHPRGVPTDYAKRLVRKYADVAAGRAHVVKVTPTAAKALSETYRVRKGRVIVPKDTLTDSVRFNKRTGELTKYKKMKGGTWSFKPAPATSIADVKALKKNQTYMIPFRRGRAIEFQTRASLEELQKLVESYEGRKSKAFADILKYLQIGTFKPAPGYEREDFGDEDEE